MKRGGPIKRRSRNSATLNAAREVVQDRSAGWCEARLTGCDLQGNQAHHVRRRSQGGSDTPDNLKWVCSTCHAQIHANPERSYAMGLLQRRGQTDA